MTIADTYPSEVWWMDDQKELVEDNSRNWFKKTFKMVPVNTFATRRKYPEF
jgi:hypothetical protein